MKLMNWLTKLSAIKKAMAIAMAFFICVAMTLLIVLAVTFADGHAARTEPIVFQSSESETEAGAPVFNEIGFSFIEGHDVWIMRQSHHGFTADRGKWDRLAIVVSDQVAHFYQLKPGDIKVSSLSEIRENAVPLKARCFACHSNGPRAIRMNVDSPTVSVPLLTQFKVALLNLRVKTYGRVESQEGMNGEGGVPFRSAHKIMGRPMALQSCVKCHAESGLRNALTLEQLGTAAYLVREGFMPPFPFTISDEDRAQLSLVE